MDYDASSVVEQAIRPAKFGKLAARHNVVEIAEACWKESARDSVHLDLNQLVEVVECWVRL